MWTLSLGSTADTWGRAWAPGDLADANFRVRLSDVSKRLSTDFVLDSVAVNVTYN